MGEGEGEKGNGTGRGSQVGEAQLRSQDTSGRAFYFPSRSLGRPRKRREKRKFTRPVRQGHTEVLSTHTHA